MTGSKRQAKSPLAKAKSGCPAFCFDLVLPTSTQCGGKTPLNTVVCGQRLSAWIGCSVRSFRRVERSQGLGRLVFVWVQLQCLLIALACFIHFAQQFISIAFAPPSSGK